VKKTLFIAVIVALSLGHTTRSMAQAGGEEPVQEVFQTELVYPQEKGAFQLTSSFTFSKADKELSNDLTLEYGLTHSWQIDLQWQSFSRKKAVDGLINAWFRRPATRHKVQLHEYAWLEFPQRRWIRAWLTRRQCKEGDL
jgi:hypothetical protein